MEQLLLFGRGRLILLTEYNTINVCVYGVNYGLMPSAISNQTFKNSNYFGIISQYSHTLMPTWS